MASQLYCPATLYAGGCDSPTCTLKHNARFCAICAVVCSPPEVYVAHERGRQHRTNLATHNTSSLLLCSICNVIVSGQNNWSPHIAGAAHGQYARNAGISPSIYPRDPSVPNSVRCLVCQKVILDANWPTHLLSVAHIRQQNASFLRGRFERAQQDRRGVLVSHADSATIDFGVISRAQAQQGLYTDVTVSASSPYSSVSLFRAECFGSGTAATLLFTASIIGDARKLVSGRVIHVHVTFRHAQRGRFKGRLELTLRDGAKEEFVIVRELRAVVGNKDDHELLKAVAPYVHRKPPRWQTNTSTVAGDRPRALDIVKWVKPLLPSTIPPALAQTLRGGSSRKVLAEIRNLHLPRSLDVRTHGRHFQTLLWIEEHRLVEDLRMYDMADVTFTRDGGLYTLPVPGLAEKRPSVVIGDIISVQNSRGGGQTHLGYVHDVRLADIRVHFHHSFSAAGRYNVRFEWNRTPIKRQHQALLAHSTSDQRLLLPLPVHAPLDRPIRNNESPLSTYNALIKSNAPQLQAVKSILRLKSGTAPFILFGPPGTGKTVTVVEAILQLLRSHPNACILACAPSNSAADLLAERLASALGPSELFRCNAIFRNRTTLPDTLVAYSSFQEKHFALPNVRLLKSYKVIVSTCSNASFAYNIGIPAGHFSHIIIDEAGQGSEPEVLTAGIKTMVTNETRVVLSGDPEQLGPVVRSSIARELGLGVSYMERLMARPLYADAGTGRGRSFIKLVKNFRSHKAILAYPNEKFYKQELEVCGSPAQINSFLDSSLLVSPRFPVVFHSMFGENERESMSPSYFNIDEATEVVEYVKDLLKDRRHPVRAKDIGVITPYFAQVRKIRTLLRKANINDLKVASVEEFQGQERRVIIISTVRSNRDLLSYDAKFTLGFVSNPRRFNVAVTRAQALLIVIGDPSILSVDPMWRGFLNYVYLRGGWRGDPPTWDTDAPVRTQGNYAAEMREAAAAEMDALIARLADGEDVEGEANFDQPFQETE